MEPPSPDASPPFGKVDVVHHMADRYGYRRYLEIATSTTGFTYGLVDRGRFDDCRRLLYRCPADFSDGHAIDFRSAGNDISGPVAALAAEGARFDIVFVDPFHEYAESRRDLEFVLSLLVPGGAMVVHDCLPPEDWLAAPRYVEGPWCGVTYKAYLDVVLGRNDLRYLTVDTDFGCGVVRKTALTDADRIRAISDRGQQSLIAEWRSVGDHYKRAWRLFAGNQAALLRLIGVDAFVAGRHGLGEA